MPHHDSKFLSPIAAIVLTSVLATESSGQELLYRRAGQPLDLLGARLEPFADLDGDQVPDYLVSALGAVQARGTVSVYSGATGNPLFTITGPPWQGQGGPDGFGPMSYGGDVDGDGVPDLLIGAPGDNAPTRDEGTVTVFSGATQLPIHQFSGAVQYARLGHAVSDLADLDGDGRHEFVVSASGDLNSQGVGSGSVSVYSGANASVVYRLEGTRNNELFGLGLETMSDVDGDGVPELLVGATEFGTAGAVHVFSGATGAPMYSVSGLTPNDQFGLSISAISDQDGDGLDDFLVGARQLLGGSGYFQLRSGATGTLLFFDTGAAPYDQLGTSVARAGDVNGDGVEDFLVGANQRSVNNSRIGYARLYSGKTWTVLYQFEGGAPLDDFGSSVVGLGDLDGDGRPEIGIGAYDSGANQAGYFEVYRGNDLFLNLSSNQAAAGDVLIRTVGEGAQSGSVVEFVTSVNGSPVLQLIEFASLGFDGRKTRVDVVPPGLSGITVTLRAWAQGVNGGLAESFDETLVLQ